MAVACLEVAVAALFLLVVYRQVRRRLQRLARQAYYDDLTGLPNGTRFRETVERAIADANGEGVAVLLLDLDRLKEVNETFGHRSGDAVLREVATRLAKLDAPGIELARVGGDEFGILVRAGAESASTVGERALDALKRPFVIDGVPLAVEASIGVVLAPAHATGAASLIRCADIAVYAAKERRADIAVYDPESNPNEAGRLALGVELGRALANEELVLYYQPKISLASGRIIGVETLVRWQHPRRGLLQPSEFMPFAERTGLIRPLSRYLLERAIRQCSVWQSAAIDLHVAVNLTMHDLVDAELPTEVAKLLAEAGLPPERLELEITETAIMRDPFRVRQVLLRLSEMGVRIAIDDFGTGYSSLGFLKQLPVDELKIDRTFVSSMTTDANDATIVRSTIELGRNLGLTVVAEGVETPETLERLKELGCGAAQGYLMGQPAPAEELTGLLFADLPLTRPTRRGPRRLELLR